MKLSKRDIQLLTWLIHMKFMLLDQITEVFFKGCNPKRAPYRRILKLMKAGYIAKKKVYIEPKDVYIPTQKAAKLLEEEDIPFTLGLSKDKDFANYKHDKALIDLRILFRELEISTWIPERVVRSVKPQGATPDAVLMTRRGSYAIEYERTEKRISRYKYIFNRYRDREHYDATLYICNSKSFIRKLQDKYYPLGHIYFITFEDLFRLKEDAIFYSQSDGIAITDLRRKSLDKELKDVDRFSLEQVIHPAKDESWKDGKPYISPYGGGGKSRKEDNYSQEEYDEEREYEQSMSMSCDGMYPPMYPEDVSEFEEDHY